TIDCGTVERLISNAYVLNGERLENNDARVGDVSWWKGGPEWIRYDKFSIEASAPGVSDRAILLGPMLRALLEDRFKLKIRRETQQVPIYEMAIAKGGLKLTPMPAGGCSEPGDQLLDRDAARANADAILTGAAKPVCSGMTMMGGPGHAVWILGGTSLPGFAHTLSMSLDHYVVDKTGASPDTKYNIRLEFAPDEHVPGVDKRNPRTSFAPPDAPVIFTALEQQLGVTLTPGKGPQGVLVIDHIERPSPDGPATVSQRAKGPGR
ncbi:MAG TPA: TIGR03435 family protein, partial [Vicinamibacterales bacterium]